MEVVWSAIILFLIAIFSGGNGGNNQTNHFKRQASKPPIEQSTPKPEKGKENKPVQQPDKPPTSVPTPALLPGLIGLGVAAFRKHKLAKDETSV
ncbi:MAG: PTPA-CTERM sorting domain-containing protein [Stenomitos rutilans HA7619-LM2]|jgi:hypothetical protein|nr:PTPA-CTERM sorting domain-containing protein [Stenomitos rutilans HA7619-LM2]